MAEPVPPLHTSWLGEGAVLCQSDPAPLEPALQERFWTLAEAVRRLPFAREAVPGMNNLLVMIDPDAEGEAAVAAIRQCWATAGRRAVAGREVTIPVRYGGEGGYDLAHVAAVTGLAPAEVVRRHSAGCYVVYALGSQPGFGYLAGLDPALAVPRRDVPRVRVEGGSVVIGGAQTGVISRTSPSGWHVIGTTDLPFFDPDRDPPALLAPGDTIRFTIESLVP
ncbi:5-oxoprolinase subunit PxpB [Roseomonas sp. NAR14]|uniref:5-oxoprolinase subunit PxpB n=1 Tax=Roseomonas acroporae TaxID=2937791 RepID=A0A9X1YCA5_9PROT|nr:5-oxoprolinase subunit PxpB [Roseomonas acroporae]MCK8787779.1 5-oxoprolinase subunit PxpB [Roseomonas acroporae]